MANLLTNFISQVLQGDTVKDWNHATKIFVDGNYSLAPKNSFLYHVYFEINPSAKTLNGMNDTTKQQELGMMVKQVSLPKFTIDTKSLNAYNRPNLVQTKIHYDPVNIVFHDDAANIVRNFWFDYYSYYYRNSDQGASSNMSPFMQTHDEITNERTVADWGYTIRGSTKGTAVKDPYLVSIRIFSLFNKQFSEYVLVNPLIKSFQHGEHNSSASTDSMQHSMTVEYESVVYASGKTTATNVPGFLALHYDKRPSPLSPAGGGTGSFTGPGGIFQSATEVMSDLQSGNLGSALFKGLRVTNGLKGANLGSMAITEAISLGRNIISGGNNPFSPISVPNVGGLITGIGAAGASMLGISSTVTTSTGIAGTGGGFQGVIDRSAATISEGVTNAGTGISAAMSTIASEDPSRMIAERPDLVNAVQSGVADTISGLIDV